MTKNVVFISGRDAYQWNTHKKDIFDSLCKQYSDSKEYKFIYDESLKMFGDIVCAGNNLIYPENTLIFVRPSYGSIVDGIDSLKNRGFRVDEYISTEKLIENKIKLNRFVNEIVNAVPIFWNNKNDSKYVFSPSRKNFPFVETTNLSSTFFYKDEPYLSIGFDRNYLTFMEVYILMGKVVDFCTGRFYTNKVALAKGEFTNGYVQTAENCIYNYDKNCNVYNNNMDKDTEAEMDKLLEQECEILEESETLATELKFSSVAMYWIWNPLEESYQFMDAKSTLEPYCKFFMDDKDWTKRMTTAVSMLLREGNLKWESSYGIEPMSE